MAVRVTRLVIESVGRGEVDALRVGRVGIEVSGRGSVDALRVSRVTLEALGEQVASRFHVSRVSLEVLGGPVSSELQVSRVSLEVLGEQVSSRLHASRISLEVLGGPVSSELQVSRVSLEVLGDPLYVQVSRIGLEILGSRKESLQMFTFEAPYPAIQTTSLLPNPQFSDQEGSLATVSRKLAMDGTRYTYVKRRNRRKLKWQFQLTRNKGLEVRAFFQSYFASKIRVTDHNGRVWIGYFVNNPFEFDTTGRAAPAIAPLPRGERQAVEIEFEGVEQ